MKDKTDFFKIYRSIEDWEWYKDVYTYKLFSHLILKANWKDSRFMGYDIPRGSLATSLESLASQTGLTIQQIRTSLKKLENTGEITRKSTNKFTLINVVNYRVFQDENSKSNKRATNEQQTNNKRVTTIEEKKEKKETNIINNISIYGEFQNVKLSDEEHQKLIDEFGEAGTSAIIKILDTYKGSSGKKYKSDYLAIRNWVIDRYKQDSSKKNVSFLDL